VQDQQLRHARAQQKSLEFELTENQNRLAVIEKETAQMRRTLSANQPQLDQYQAEIARKRGQRINSRLSETDGLYLWSESTDYVRLPKSLIPELELSGAIQLPITEGKTLRKQLEPLDRDGELSSALREVLGVTEPEQAGLLQVFTRASSEFEKLAAEHYYLTNHAPPGVEVEVGARESMTWVQTGFVEEGLRLKKELCDGVEQILGQERAAVVFQQGEATFANAYNSLGTLDVAETVTVESSNQISYWKAIRRPGEEKYTVTQMNSGYLKLDCLPEPLRPFVANKLKQEISNP
jgi:hypothetical protein